MGSVVQLAGVMGASPYFWFGMMALACGTFIASKVLDTHKERPLWKTS